MSVLEILNKGPFAFKFSTGAHFFGIQTFASKLASEFHANMGYIHTGSIIYPYQFFIFVRGAPTPPKKFGDNVWSAASRLPNKESVLYREIP